MTRLAVPGQDAFAVGDGAVLQRRVDDDLVFVWHKTLQLPVREAKAPGFGVVACAIGNPVGTLGEGVEPGEELGERHPCVHRCAVIHNMQIVLLKVDHAAAGGILDVSVADVPFLRDDPIERPCAGRDFVGGEGKEGGELAEALP